MIVIEIRQYQAKDLPYVEEICSPPGSPMRDALLRCFCHYYVEREPENCFVCEVDGIVCGYIVCAENFEKWEAEMQRTYMIDDPVCAAIGSATIENLRPFAEEYPSHLHIDFAPEAQGKGLGTRLLQHLISHLKEKSVSGIVLDVAADNLGAQRFYARNGFAVLNADANSMRMGIPLASYKKQALAMK